MSVSNLNISSHTKIIVGCTAAVISSACQSIGLILQRKSHIVSESSTSNNLKPPTYNRSLWHIGLFLFLFANIFGSSIQITSLPLVVLSPLQSIGLVFNTIFHTILLDEPFTTWSLYGTILISLGAFFTAYCGNSLVEPEYTLTQFIEFLKNINFINLVLIDLFILFITTILIFFLNKQILHNSVSNHLNMIDIHLANIQYKLESYNYQETNKVNLYSQKVVLLISRYFLQIHINILHLLFIHDILTLRKVKGLLYGILSGTLSGFSILLAKSSIEILITTFINHDWKSLNDSTAYFIVIIFLLLCVSQLFLLNKGLKNISTSVLYPLVFFVYNIISISNSLVFFKQWNQLTYNMFFILLIGSSLVMIGVFLLSLQNIDEKYQYNTSMEEFQASPISSHSSNSFSLSNTNSNTNSTSKHFSPILKPKAKYYDSIGARVINSPYRDDVEGFEDDVVGELEDDEDEDDYPRSIPETPIPNSTMLSNSIGTLGQSNNILTNNDIIAPFIKRTTENLNNASRKVSGFLSLKNTSNYSTFNNNNNNNNIYNRENSDVSLKSNNPTRRLADISSYSNSTNSNQHNIHEYVSFDSLRDMTNPSNNNTNSNISNSGNLSSSIKTITANFSDYDSLLQDNNNKNTNTNNNSTNNTVSHGLNIFNPIFDKLKRQTSVSDIPTQSSSTNEINDDNTLSKIPSSYKSIALSLKHFASFDNSQNGSNAAYENDKSSRMKKKSTHSRKSLLDDDYNPNNNFNYSFNNTLEEIQHQLNEYESKTSIDRIPSPKTKKNVSVLENDSSLDESRDENNTSLNLSNISNLSTNSNDNLDSPTNVLLPSRILPRAHSTKMKNSESSHHFQHSPYSPHSHHQRSRSRELRRSTVADIRFGSRKDSANHKRILSFEQNELLNDLKK